MKALTRVVLALVLAAGAIGCGKACSVSGTVTRDGKPLEWADEEGHLLVIFIPEDRDANKNVYRAETDRKTGSYRIDSIPAGPYRVAVQQFDKKHNDALGHKYNPPQTPLRYEVTKSDQVIDIDLP
jgi:hypothetical protein